MTADVARGSYDDVPEADVHVTLAVPLQAPEQPWMYPAALARTILSGEQGSPVVTGAPVGRRAHAARSAPACRPGRHRRPTPVRDALRVGLAAAVTVFVVLAAVLLAVELLID